MSRYTAFENVDAPRIDPDTSRAYAKGTWVLDLRTSDLGLLSQVITFTTNSGVKREARSVKTYVPCRSRFAASRDGTSARRVSSSWGPRGGVWGQALRLN